jgi:hypothetical protein
MSPTAVSDQNIFEFAPEHDTAPIRAASDPAAAEERLSTTGRTSAIGLFDDSAEPATRPHRPVRPPADEATDFEDYAPRRFGVDLPPALRRLAVSMACALAAFIAASVAAGVLHSAPPAKPVNRALRAAIVQRPSFPVALMPRSAHPAAPARGRSSTKPGPRHRTARLSYRPRSARQRTRRPPSGRAAASPSVLARSEAATRVASAPSPTQSVVEPARVATAVDRTPAPQSSPPPGSGGSEFGFEN